jgi:hypothetical protein
MSLDQRLRNGLHRSASTISPNYSQAFHTVLRRADRRRRVRMVGRLVALGAALAIIGVGVVVVRGLDLTRGGVDPVTDPALTGTYTVDVPDSADARQAGLVGRWEVALRADNTIRLTPPSTAFTGSRDGSYRVEDDLFRSDLFLDIPGCQVAQTQVGTYRVARVGDQLTFTEVDDSCAARREFFSQPWKGTP